MKFSGSKAWPWGVAGIIRLCMRVFYVINRIVLEKGPSERGVTSCLLIEFSVKLYVRAFKPCSSISILFSLHDIKHRLYYIQVKY